MTIYSLAGRMPRIHPNAYVHPAATIIGDVTLGDGASVWPGAVLRGDFGAINVGCRSSVQDCCVIHATESLATLIGADCVIGHSAHLEGCVVSDGVLCGSGSVVLNGATIGPGAVIGAGAVVTQGTVVPARSLALGVPAQVRPDVVSMNMVEESVNHYLTMARTHRSDLRALTDEEVRRIWEVRQ